MNGNHTDPRGLILLALLACLLLASCAWCQEGTAIATQRKADAGTVIPIDAVGGRTLVTIRIGDVDVPRILLDTGMSFDGVMIYNPAYADSLDLAQAIDVRVPGAGGGEASNAVMVDSAEFDLGSIRMKNQRIILLKSDIYKGFPTNGIIGYSIFGHYAAEMDYDRKAMVLYGSGAPRVDSTWTEVPLYFKANNIPWVNVAVVIADEKPISVSTYIDFAASEAIVLLERPVMKFALPRETKDVHLGRGLSGDVYGKAGRISKLIIGGYELTDVPAGIAPAAVRSKQPDADAVLGNLALSKFNLIFDYAGRKLYLRPNASFSQAFR
jgi:hypothetical protein